MRGSGIVAGRKAYEDWLDKGWEPLLRAVVDPNSGKELDEFRVAPELYDKLSDPAFQRSLAGASTSTIASCLVIPTIQVFGGML